MKSNIAQFVTPSPGSSECAYSYVHINASGAASCGAVNCHCSDAFPGRFQSHVSCLFLLNPTVYFC